MPAIYLALGSNVGDSERFFDEAITLLGIHVSKIKQAKRYRTKPVGYIEQPDFLNSALSGYTDLTPQALLEFIKEIEDNVGRIKRFRWGPREIDIDVIFYGNKIIRKPGLTIPHARFAT